jgi:poly(glycerol-phosphate) alpha-glucosyltransferase
MMRDKNDAWHVNDMFSPYCLVMSAVGLLAQRDVVICPHGMLDSWALNNGHTWFKYAALRGLNVLARFGRLHIHALNADEYAAANRMLSNARRSEIIPNAVPSDILGIRDSFPDRATRCGPIIIGCMSRISPKKNQVAVVDLAVRIRHSRPDLFEAFEFRIDGQVEDTEYAQELENRIDSEGLRQNIIMGGNVPFEKRAACLAGYDILFFPSKSEGMPYVVLEAMALGTMPLVSCTSMCDFVKPFGGKVYQDLNDAIAGLPQNREDLQHNGLNVDWFLEEFGTRKLHAFMDSFEK